MERSDYFSRTAAVIKSTVKSTEATKAEKTHKVPLSMEAFASIVSHKTKMLMFDSSGELSFKETVVDPTSQTAMIYITEGVEDNKTGVAKFYRKVSASVSYEVIVEDSPRCKVLMGLSPKDRGRLVYAIPEGTIPLFEVAKPSRALGEGEDEYTERCAEYYQSITEEDIVALKVRGKVVLPAQVPFVAFVRTTDGKVFGKLPELKK